MVVISGVTLEITPNNTVRYPIGSGWTKTGGNSYTFKPGLPFGSTNFGWQAGDSSHWDQTGNTTWSGNEWPGSGMFDKRQPGVANAGWHIYNGNCTVPYNSTGSTYAYIYLNWPIKGYITYYSVQVRAGCCQSQAPSAWILYTGGTVIDSRSNERSWTAGSTRGYTPSNQSTLCSGCSFNILAANGASGDCTNVSELRIYVTPDTDNSGYSNFNNLTLGTMKNWAVNYLSSNNASTYSMSSLRGWGGIPSNATNMSLSKTVLAYFWNS